MGFNVNKFNKIAKKEGIDVKLFERRKQASDSGRILDFDVKCGKVNRVKITTGRIEGNYAGIYHHTSSKSGLIFKSYNKLIKRIKKIGKC